MGCLFYVARGVLSARKYTVVTNNLVGGRAGWVIGEAEVVADIYEFSSDPIPDGHMFSNRSG